MPEEEILSQEPAEPEAAEPEETEDSGTSEPAETEETAESTEPENQEPAESSRPRKGVQSRIDQLVREREEWKRQALQGVQLQMPEPQTAEASSYPDLPKPDIDQFDTYDGWVEAMTDWRFQVNARKSKEVYQRQAFEQHKNAWHQEAETKYDDWYDVFGSNNTLTISDIMADVLMNGDNGIDVAYFLGKNPKEAKRIFNLPPSRQAYELGKLEMKLSSNPPPQRNQTKAPKPTSPVGGKETPAKRPEDMSYEDYKAWRSQGGGK